MNNGPKKGGSTETWATLKSSPGLEDIWQLHYSVPRPANNAFYETRDPGGKDLNAPDQFIANLGEDATHMPVHYLKVSALPDGTFVVVNSRNNFTKTYSARQAQSAQSLPMPKYHHIHINSVDPGKSLEWYAKYWPAGSKTTLAGFPAFHAGDLYLVYSKVATRARRPGRSVDQARFTSLFVPSGLLEPERHTRGDSLSACAAGRSVADTDAVEGAPSAREERTFITARGPGPGGRRGTSRGASSGPTPRESGFRVPRRSGRDARRVQFRAHGSFLAAQPLLA
jgi:hypothetical protein